MRKFITDESAAPGGPSNIEVVKATLFDLINPVTPLYGIGEQIGRAIIYMLLGRVLLS